MGLNYDQNIIRPGKVSGQKTFTREMPARGSSLSDALSESRRPRQTFNHFWKNSPFRRRFTARQKSARLIDLFTNEASIHRGAHNHGFRRTDIEPGRTRTPSFIDGTCEKSPVIESPPIEFTAKVPASPYRVGRRGRGPRTALQPE